MNNHFHFLLRGEYLDVKRFAKAYLQRRLAAIKKVYSEIKHSEDIDLSIKHIADTDYLRGVCGYILRNPMAAGMNVIPTAYLWSSASMYFNDNHCLPSGRKLSSLSIRMQRELFPRKSLCLRTLFLTTITWSSPDNMSKFMKWNSISTIRDSFPSTFPRTMMSNMKPIPES